MKTKKIALLALALMYVFGVSTFAQVRKGVENDDMYFSKKDRELLYASNAKSTDYSSDQNYNSDYYDSHNFSSPTVQSSTAGSPTVQEGEIDEDADNNQYYIKDYSIPKENKTTGTTVVNNYYSGYPSSPMFGYGSNLGFSISVGYFYGSPYYGYYNPYYSYYDPFYRYYGPYYSFYDSWGYPYYSYNPWRRHRYNYGYSGGYYGGYYNSASCYYPTNGYTNYSGHVANEVRYKNGRKIISGSRTNRSVQRADADYNGRGRTVKVADPSNPNGRSATDGKSIRETYRKYRTNNSSTVSPNRNSNNRSRSYNSNTNRTNTNWNRSNSNTQRSNNTYRSTGSSNRSSNYNSGTRSSGSSNRSSGSNSRSSGSSSNSNRGRGRGN